MLPLTGQILDGKYRIDRQLGAGGMGAVYLATHLGTTRPVALKVIAPQFMANAEFVERFKREAEAAGRLRHPNVVNVTDFGFARHDAEQLAYLVMEYLDGQTLGALLRRQQQLPLAFVVDVVEQVCLAIDKAHKQGIIHRDLKPDNIWLEPNGRGGYNVKVLDFGLAKLRQAAPLEQHRQPSASSPVAPTLLSTSASSESAATETFKQTDDVTSSAPTLVDDASAAESETLLLDEGMVDERKPDEVRRMDTNPAGELTQAGAVLGTPHYMSPEQCRGEPLSASSDLYSLGIITYQMITGETPFTGTTTGALLTQHIEAPPPSLTEKRRDIPRSVATLVMSALAKDPAARPSDAIAFATSLRTNAAGERALVRQALTFYSEHFATFIALSLSALTPATISVAAFFVAAAAFFIESLIPPLHNRVVFACATLIFMLGIFVYNAVIGGLVVPIVAQLQVAPLRPLRLRPLLSALTAKLRAYLITSILAHTSFLFLVLPLMLFAASPAYITAYLISSPVFWLAIFCWLLIFALLLKRDQRAGKWLYAPVVLVEGEQGRRALARSKVLVDRLAGSLGNLFPLFTVTVIGITILATMISWLLLKQLDKGMNWLDTLTAVIVVALSVLLSLLLSVLLNPLIATIMALFYLKARQTGGETFTRIDDDASTLNAPTE